MPSNQFRWFILTIPYNDWVPPSTLPAGVSYLAGQGEEGEGGYRHWQLVAYFATKVTLSGAKRSFPTTSHLEPTRSSAARAYVWKEETRVEGSQFELGDPPFRRGDQNDWNAVLDAARRGEYDNIPADILVRNYSAIRRITTDHLQPVGMEREVHVYWGRSGTGKSQRAWLEAGPQAYPKDPATKFWDGYRAHENVVIDEFRGSIGIYHLLRWFDRYPCLIELKGSATVLMAKTFWITSNISPDDWYPDLDQETKNALKRRLNITWYPYITFSSQLHLEQQLFEAQFVYFVYYDKQRQQSQNVPKQH